MVPSPEHGTSASTRSNPSPCPARKGRAGEGSASPRWQVTSSTARSSAHRPCRARAASSAATRFGCASLATTRPAQPPPPLPPPPPPPPSASQAAALESCTRGGMCACWLSESKARKAGTCSTCGRDTLSHTSSRSSTTRYAALNSSSSAGSASAGWRWERLLLKLSGWLSSRQRTRPWISRTSGSIALRTLRVYDLAAIV
mmetsp:Transcript_13761/g.45913  ORF Transcript_13761/g.45913 Transcript_13761/m.45913 type:complete len:201 (-) Transcript_13761:409-1011(-)